MSRRPGRRPTFTEADVISAAFEVGLDRFTLAQVAERIGVATPALYRLFGSRDAIVDAALASVASSVAVPEPGKHWREVLQIWGEECWRICEEHPGLAQTVYTVPTASSHISATAQAYADQLVTQGLTPGQVMFALDFIGDTVFHTHLGVTAMRGTDEQGRTGLDRLRERLTDGPMRPDDSWTGRGAMDIKLNFILDGLEHQWPEFPGGRQG